jgi:hypothetical protein
MKGKVDERAREQDQDAREESAPSLIQRNRECARRSGTP